MIPWFIRHKTIFWRLLFGTFFLLMLEITLKYVPINPEAGFLTIKQTEVSRIPAYLPIFYTHVFSSIFVLLSGFTQFNDHFLKTKKQLHRIIGSIYIGVVLLLASPSGLFIGYYANGGLYSKIAFILLSLLWFSFTLRAFISIKNKEVDSHLKFMYRSFALTFSAITLRVWKVILVYLFQPAPMDVYQAIAWLGWVPNIIVIECYLYKRFKS